MARRTTVVLRPDEEAALRRTSRAEGLSQSELIRRGIEIVTAGHRKRPKPTVGWLRLTRAERAALRPDDFGDPDA